MGLPIFRGGVIISANLISDLACAFVDPRIKLDKAS